MRNIFFLAVVYCLLFGCGFGGFVDKCVNGPPPNPPHEPLRDTSACPLGRFKPEEKKIDALMGII